MQNVNLQDQEEIIIEEMESGYEALANTFRC